MARHGILAKACEMTYTADKLAAYCDDYTKVNKDVMADIYKEIKVTITKETEDALSAVNVSVLDNHHPSH